MQQYTKKSSRRADQVARDVHTIVLMLMRIRGWFMLLDLFITAHYGVHLRVEQQKLKHRTGSELSVKEAFLNALLVCNVLPTGARPESFDMHSWQCFPSVPH